MKRSPAPDKETDAMAWAGHMNLLKAMAEEVVVRKLIIHNVKWSQLGNGLVSLWENCR